LVAELDDLREKIARAKTTPEAVLPAFTGVTRVLIDILDELQEIRAEIKSQGDRNAHRS
jgi:hypothetical protein